MLNTLSHAFVATPSVREISGRLLAFNRMKPRARAKLAADLVELVARASPTRLGRHPKHS